MNEKSKLTAFTRRFGNGKRKSSRKTVSPVMLLRDPSADYNFPFQIYSSLLRMFLRAVDVTIGVGNIFSIKLLFLQICFNSVVWWERNGNWYRDYQKWNSEKESHHPKCLKGNKNNILRSFNNLITFSYFPPCRVFKSQEWQKQILCCWIPSTGTNSKISNNLQKILKRWLKKTMKNLSSEKTLTYTKVS